MESQAAELPINTPFATKHQISHKKCVGAKIIRVIIEILFTNI
jgi:hypothetical protein